ncbi:hypothetical protein V5N11_003549 [Cardamine amara subsp. amara]|uniref:Integrase catalytic domain-containing protein n=1 Tax=Cardamine amara subsp. amara TaxID=228776 RepID=A0ABD1C209_CARAN
MTHFIPCSRYTDAIHVVGLFFKEIVRIHGIPTTIVSDRYPKLFGHFWRTLWKKLGTKLLFSTASHSQTYGQTEVANRTLGALLRATIGGNLKNYVECILLIEFAFNQAVHSATKC